MNMKFLLIPALFCLFGCKTEKSESKKEPSTWFIDQRSYPNNAIDYRAHSDAAASLMSGEFASNRNIGFDNSYELAGPSNIGGRITDIEMPRSSQTKIYAGSASGGIFLSDDQGVTWENIFDEAPSLSIGDFDIGKDDENIIYVGTGEANAGGGSLAYDGLGVFKSQDGGNSWNFSGLENVGSIGRLQINPKNSDEVYVAAMGRLFAHGENRGVYKTADGGESWENVLFLNDSTGAIDLVINPEQTDTIFAAFWERTRKVNNLKYGGASSDLYRSYDGGQNWEKLSQGLPQNAIEKGRIGLAICASQPNNVYAFYARQDGSLQGVYRSDDHGNSWESMITNGLYDVPYMWWFGKIEVDPSDPDIVYLPAYDVHRFTEGNPFWSGIFFGAHVDQHALFIHPENPDLVVLGNDGGVYVSHDKGDQYTKSFNLPNIQFYSCEINTSKPTEFFGGAQDNGLLRSGDGVSDWDKISGGDGLQILVDPLDPNIVYGETQRGRILRSLDGGDNFDLITQNLFGRFNWNTPLSIDPQNTSLLYTGSNYVFKSNLGDNWEQISGDLTNGPHNGNATFGTITTIAVSPLESEIIYAGTDDGNLWVTLDEGNTWDEISYELPNRWVTCVAPDPVEREKIYAAFSGYRFGEDIGHIYVSEDFGASWINISNGLPDVPVNDLIIHPNGITVFAATDIGVFYTENSGLTWQVLGTDLPILPITDIDYHKNEDFLLIATYGRSMYKYNLELNTSVEEPRETINFVTVNSISENAQFYLSSDRAISYVELYSQKGEFLQRQDLADGFEASLHFPIYPAGIYYLKVIAKEGSMETKTIVIL